MTEFENAKKKPADCAVCEAMLLDAVDGTLNEAEQRMFDAHISTCSACSQELGEAQRGAAWLAILKGHTPQPSAMLLEKILAQTRGAAVVAVPTFVAASHVSESRHGAPTFLDVFAAWRQRVAASLSLDGNYQPFQPRLAMTASMAFLSIALTMNILGVRLGDVAHTLSQPRSLRRTAADAGASARRNFQNLRVVNVVESRVSDLRSNDELGRFTRRNDNDDQGSAAPSRSKQADPANGTPDTQNDKQNDKQPKKEPRKVPQGSSELLAPLPPKNAVQKEVRS